MRTLTPHSPASVLTPELSGEEYIGRPLDFLNQEKLIGPLPVAIQVPLKPPGRKALWDSAGLWVCQGQLFRPISMSISQSNIKMAGNSKPFPKGVYYVVSRFPTIILADIEAIRNDGM